MVIQITPHTEQAPTPSAASSGIPGAQEAHKAKSAQSKENKIGVFAKLLAGLSGKGPLHKTGTDATDAASLKAAGKVPLAETAQSGKKALIAGEKAKDVRIKEQIKTNKSSKNGSDEPETPQNELFAIGRLTGQAEEQKSPGKTAGKRGLEGLTANSALSGDESVKSKGIIAANSPEKQSAAANLAASAGEEAAKAALAEKAAGKATDKSADEAAAKAAKAKTRSSVENGANSGLIAGEYQRAEAKKASVEKNVPGRLEEVRNREKKRGVTFEVRDFRSGVTAENVSVRTGTEARVPGEAAGKDIVLELRLPDQGQDASSARTSWDVRSGQALENLLARELHQNFNNDIVRHASVALRDGNEGTIRLALKPESLGNVKIHLEMAENKIAGRIVVESAEALRAFEREISSLEKAFRDSGFDGANLEMSLATDSRGTQQQWQETEASQFLTEHYAASRYDAAVERMEIPLTLDVYQQGLRAVNLLA